MARRTATISHLRYWKKYARGDDKAKDFARLPDGADFLDMVADLWAALTPDQMMDPTKFRYCRPLVGREIRRGRTLTLVAEVGSYGDPASLRDADTAEERYRHDGELSHVVEVRVVLVVPGRGTSALLFIEHAAEGSLGRPLLDAISDAWSTRYPEWTLEAETLVRPEAWLANAQLEEVVAQGWGWHDVADAGVPRRLGRVTSVLRPDHGDGFLPIGILASLQSKHVSAAALLGLTAEPEEVKVRVGDGNQSKTFIIGRERTPPIRMLVTDHGTRSPTAEGFRAWSVGQASEHFHHVGVDWDHQWERDPS